MQALRMTSNPLITNKKDKRIRNERFYHTILV